LGELLGEIDTPHHARQAGDEPGPFDAKGRFDRLVRLACGHTAFSAKAAGETSRLQADRCQATPSRRRTSLSEIDIVLQR
jgi:hypothetical protein